VLLKFDRKITSKCKRSCLCLGSCITTWDTLTKSLAWWLKI